MNTVYVVNIAICVLFALCYAFQVIYVFVPYIKRSAPHKETKEHRFAVLVCARNEENVIGELIESVRAQDYPADLIDVVVIADNCTDKTADKARSLGAIVYERQNDIEIGKGYALDFGLARLCEEFGEDRFDAFIVFDADNILTESFVTEINKTFSDGYDVVTCYRNAKNYGDSWLSAGSGIWFLRESKYLNNSRMKIGACPQVSGTGFLFSNDIRKEYGGWPFHTLTEDYEFTCYSVTRGKKFGYCGDAKFYDDQVTTFKQAWNQRLRWCKGGLQSFVKFRKELTRGIFSRNFVACYDMAMSIAPAYFLSIVACLFNIGAAIALFATGYSFIESVTPSLILFAAAYLLVLSQGIMTTVSEWKNIKASTFKKLIYMFTFPFYMITFIPIAFVAIFKKDVTWSQTEHRAKEKA